MQLELIGSHPFEQDAQGRLKSAIGTIFPDHKALYTLPPPVHACQRTGFVDHLNEARKKDGRPPLTSEEEQAVETQSVDLIFEPDEILIRPDPERMELAFAADELLQELVSKRKIKFLLLSDERVRDAIKRRGECWRLSSTPKTVEGKQKLVFSSKVGIFGKPIYFYNRLTGTRWLTWQSFSELGSLDDSALAQHLDEIGEHASRSNRLGHPEIDFFAVDMRQFNSTHLVGQRFTELPPAELRKKYEELRERFRSAVHEGFRVDDCHKNGWGQRMVTTLFLEGNESQNEQITNGFSREFFLQLEWLPGGRFEQGEFLLDPVFDEAETHPQDKPLQELCDLGAKGVIFNLIREFGDLEYINVGRIPESLSIQRPQRRGRRGVYIAELKSRSEPKSIKRFARVQKWGVWEHLDEGKEMLQSIEESEEYTDFLLDRRLGCRQLGMNLTRRLALRRLSEIYRGNQGRYRGQVIRTSYFERDYLPGIATDKLPPENYARNGYALKLAALLGQAAAASLIVGRAVEEGARPVFDDGDELVVEDEEGMPADIMLGDHSGAFGDYRRAFEEFASHFAKPVNSRIAFLTNPHEFARVYLDALRAQFLRVQGDYRKRRRAFDTLFKHCKYDAAGSFGYRWERVLKRLDAANVDSVINTIRQNIKLPPENVKPVGID